MAQCSDASLDGCCSSGVLRNRDIQCVCGSCMSASQNRDSNEPVTLVTQGSLDRIVAFEETIDRWHGPIIAVIPIDNRTGNAKSSVASVRARCRTWRDNVAIYVAVLPQLNKLDTGARGIAATAFPSNSLRNVVVDLTTTPYLFYVDIDFIPSSTLYKTLVNTILGLADNLERVALVVPQWESTMCKSRFAKDSDAGDGYQHQRAAARLLPKRFDDLKGAMVTGDARPFLATLKETGLTAKFLSDARLAVNISDCGPQGRGTRDTFAGGVQLNDYRKWVRDSATSITGLIFLDQQFTMRRDKSLYGGLGTLWEPYVVVRRDEHLPRYPEFLIGRSRDKATWTIMLQAQRYTFYSVIGEFLLHFPHDNFENTPKSRADRKRLSFMNRRNSRLQRTLVEAMERNYPKVSKPRGWAVDHGFRCDSCDCCGNIYRP